MDKAMAGFAEQGYAIEAFLAGVVTSEARFVLPALRQQVMASERDPQAGTNCTG